MAKVWKHKKGVGPWASEVEYLHKKATAQAQWEKQKLAKKVVKEASLAALALPAGECEAGIDIGEGELSQCVSTLDMLRHLAKAEMGKPGERRALLRQVLGLAQAVLAERQESVKSIQAVCRGLGDGSLLAESDGTVIVRMRTQARVPVR